ncbi:MAG: aldehyde dehydrogenase (NADP(+)) [Microcella sp.]
MTASAHLTTVMTNAVAAFRELRRSDRASRAAWLAAAADALDADADALVEIAGRETRLPEQRLRGELARTSSQLRFFGEVITDGAYLEATIDHPNPSATPPIPDLRRMLVPLGPVAVFAASNFPFAFSVAGGDTASALAAGNPVIVKIHAGHPELSHRVAERMLTALLDAGAPAGILATIEGRDDATALVLHPDTAAVGFTGSIPGGRALFDLAASRPTPIPFYGELGSLNPVVITARALAAHRSELVEGLVGSFTLGAGQFCTKPGLVFVPRGSGFAVDVATAAPAVAPQPMLMPRIAEGFRAGATALRQQPGVTLVGGDAPGDGGEQQPMVFATDTSALRADDSVVREECFGPAVVIVEHDGDADLIEAIAALPGGLTATLHAAEGEAADCAALIATLEESAGRLLFGGWPTGVAVAWSQHHGGPYPATTSLFTSVGASAIRRFLRPLAFQTAPDAALPPELRDAPAGIPRRIDGELRVH